MKTGATRILVNNNNIKILMNAVASLDMLVLNNHAKVTHISATPQQNTFDSLSAEVMMQFFQFVFKRVINHDIFLKIS